MQLSVDLRAPAPAADPLRPYQRDCVDATLGAFGAGVQRGLVAIATGGGKTRIAAEVVRELPDRALMVAHREELVGQNAAALAAANPGRSVGIVQAERDESAAQIVSASIQTLAVQRRRERLGDFGLVVVDEAHHSLARSYMATLRHFGCLDDGGSLALGLTATPERTDRLSLRQVWQEVVYRQSITDLVAQGWLAKLVTRRVVVDALDLAAVRQSGGDYQAGALGDALVEADVPSLVVRAWQRHAAARRSTVVFVPTVALAHEMAGAFSAAGIGAEAIHGEHVPTERRAILDRFRAGETRVICNAMLLTEGTDIPEIDCIVWARPSRSRPLIVQAVGRGARLAPGKSDCLVLDVVGGVRAKQVMVADLDGLEELPDRERALAAVRAGIAEGMPSDIRATWERALRQRALARWMSGAEKRQLSDSGAVLRMVVVEGPVEGRFGPEYIYTAEDSAGELRKWSLSATRYRSEQAAAFREELFGGEAVEVAISLVTSTSERTGRTYYELIPAVED